MSLVGFTPRNHPQQVGKRGALSHVDDLETDPELFARLDERFHFNLDVAASPENAKCRDYYTKEADGLVQTWSLRRVWCNPPYSDIGPWVDKAQWETITAHLIVMLLPANRTEQRWWQDRVEPIRDGRDPLGPRVEFLRGRQRFIKAGSDAIHPNERPPFGCCLLIWGNSQR